MFSEITCLEYFRLQPNITALYDYGIHKGQYYIVMKKYQTSVKNWRLAQTLPLETMLPLYLRIFMKILAAVQCLHSNNITHYDLKCDNVLIDSPAVITSQHNLEELPFEIALADFGECKIFLNEDEELDLQNRGTEYIKSPEMLGLTLNSRKDGENYDRRRRPGTTRASDNWSLGCLFFELLTGKFLFYDPDWMKFFVRVANKDQELLTAANKADLNQNALLIEFIISILVRNPFHRPTVDHIMTKLKHLIPQLTTLSIVIFTNSRFSLKIQVRFHRW
jgi:serine/threonine protein kinase